MIIIINSQVDLFAGLYLFLKTTIFSTITYLMHDEYIYMKYFRDNK
jgi:hypothetical protein